MSRLAEISRHPSRRRAIRSLLYAVVFLAAATAGITLSGCSHCPRGTSTVLAGPSLVLRDLAVAYSGRDSAAYRALLTDDFAYQAGWLNWGRRQEMISAMELFTNPATKKIRLRFPCGCRVTAGDQPDTWILDHVRANMRVDRDGEPFVVHDDDHRFFVRRDSGTPSGYRIYRWESPGFERPKGHTREEKIRNASH